jgi:alpha-methylacyl-CoA racemase
MICRATVATPVLSGQQGVRAIRASPGGHVGKRAWYYNTYETADGRYISFGSLEPQFFAETLRLTGLADDGLGAVPDPGDRTQWGPMQERLAALIRTKTRDEWCALLEGSDACFAPVLDLDEAPTHLHLAARGTFTEIAGVVQPAPAPRFSRTVAAITRPPSYPGQHTDLVLAMFGFSAEEIQKLRRQRAIG